MVEGSNAVRGPLRLVLDLTLTHEARMGNQPLHHFAVPLPIGFANREETAYRTPSSSSRCGLG